MATKITYDNQEDTTTEIVTGNIFSIVSLFETWTVVFDVSKLSKTQIKRALELDRDEAEDYLDDVADRIELIPAESTGSDNNYHDIEAQSDTHAIVCDVNGVVEYTGGVREYMDDFGEYWNAVYGDNGELIVESDENYVQISFDEIEDDIDEEEVA